MRIVLHIEGIMERRTDALGHYRREGLFMRCTLEGKTDTRGHYGSSYA